MEGVPLIWASNGIYLCVCAKDNNSSYNKLSAGFHTQGVAWDLPPPPPQEFSIQIHVGGKVIGCIVNIHVISPYLELDLGT